MRNWALYLGRSWWLISSTWLGSTHPLVADFGNLAPTGGHLGHHIWEKHPCWLISVTWDGSAPSGPCWQLDPGLPLVGNFSNFSRSAP